MTDQKPDPIGETATADKPDAEMRETRVIDGEAVEIAPSRGVGVAALAGFAGGVVGAGLVAAGFYFLVPGQPGALVDQVARLDARVGDAEGELSRALSKSASEVDGLKSQLALLVGEVAAQNADEKIDALSALVTALQSEIDTAQETLSVLDPAVLSARLDGLDGRANALLFEIEELKSAQLPADLPARVGLVAQGVNAAAEQITQLSRRLTVAEEAIARPDPTAEAALGIAIANLSRTLDQGQPFVAELDAIAALAPEDPAVAALRPVAVTGVRTFAKLDENFAGLVTSLLTAERQAGREGVWDKLVGNAMSIVTIRRVGDVEGDSVEAIVARVEARLGDEDLAGAVAEAARLDGPAGELVQPWLAAAKLRVETDGLVRALSARVLSHLAQGKG